MYQRNKCHKNGLFDQSKVLRNKTASLIRKSKRNYFNKAIEDNRTTSVLWRKLKTISNLQQTRQACLPNTIKTVDGRFVEDTLNIENELNKHFINISSIIDKLKFIEDNLNDIQQCKLGSHVHVFNIQYITMHEVSRIIYGLNNIKSTGLDEISVQILQYCGDVIVLSINSLIDNSIASGIFPDELKIFKSGDSDIPEKYRPISILPILSKIFERHIADQMQEYFKLTDIIYKYQSGFRKYHSCSTALTRLIDRWLKEIDNGNIIGTVYLDLRKSL